MKGFSKEVRKYEGIALRDLILGGQDGVVDIIGVILGVAVATANVKFVLIAGFSSAVAEAFSMGAVAYTSGKVLEEYLKNKRKNNSLKFTLIFDMITVFIATLIGGVIPIIPFLPILNLKLNEAIITSLILSLVVLFSAGVLTGRLSNSKNWIRSGFRILLFGAGAALLGYIAGNLLRLV